MTIAKKINFQYVCKKREESNWCLEDFVKECATKLCCTFLGTHEIRWEDSST